MIVTFDHYIFAMQQYGGISRYFARLSEGLTELGVNTNILAPYHQNRYLRGISHTSVFGKEIESHQSKISRLRFLANSFLSDRQCRKLNPDIIHETYYTDRPLAGRPKARIVTVHDMIHEKFRSSFKKNDPTSKNKFTAVSRADHVICISQNTKSDLCELFSVPEDKITVVHLGVDPETTTLIEQKPVAGGRPYLLFVGNRGGYKNFNTLLRAFASRKHISAEFDLIAFGGGPFNRTETALIRRLGLRSNCVQHVGGDDQQLQDLYRSAYALVFPSLYEGFGLPPLEAMVNGCPVISSDTSSMPEVIRDAAQYFSPSDTDSIADAIEAVTNDGSRRDELIRQGKKRLSAFSWEKCCAETLDVYNFALRE
jgi:glycosyltransferase involved in cell wall biosynthesis